MLSVGAFAISQRGELEIDLVEKGFMGDEKLECIDWGEWDGRGFFARDGRPEDGD